MISFSKSLPRPPENLIVAFDLEWTKNYKIKNGNTPFCFSFVYFTKQDSIDNYENMEFGFINNYIQALDEEPELLKRANDDLGNFLKQKGILVGHQLISDISVILSRAENNKNNFIKLKQLWQIRRSNNNSPINVFDTRYDLKNYLTISKEKAVDWLMSVSKVG
ncbi:MAG: hypothetical protein K6U80_19215 [Firmicutes bacterium]|nr:hypothetical protein [Bacillota bacterium]